MRPPLCAESADMECMVNSSSTKISAELKCNRVLIEMLLLKEYLFCRGTKVRATPRVVNEVQNYAVTLSRT